MSIVVQGVPNASYGQAALAIGSGMGAERRQQTAFDQSHALRQLDFNRDQFEYGKQRDSALDQQRLIRDQADRENALALEALRQQSYTDREILRAELDDRQKQALQNGELAFTNSQKQELADISDRINRVHAMPWSQQEKQQAIKQLQAQAVGIRPLPQFPEPQQFPNGKGIGEVWTDESSGAVFTRQADSEVKLLIKPTDETTAIPFRDYTNLYNQVYQEMTTDDGEGNLTSPNPMEVEQQVRNRLEAYQRVSGKPAAERTNEHRHESIQQIQQLRRAIQFAQARGKVREAWQLQYQLQQLLKMLRNGGQNAMMDQPEQMPPPHIMERRAMAQEQTFPDIVPNPDTRRTRDRPQGTAIEDRRGRDRPAATALER